MEIKEICDSIIDLYENTAIKDQDRSSCLRLVYQLQKKINVEEFTNKDLNLILLTIKKIASTKKSLKQILEKELLKLIVYLPYELWESEEEESPFFARDIKTKEGQMAESLILFAKEIYEIVLDRDSFAGKRRGYSIQILESLSNYFKVPEFMDLCYISLKSKSKNEIIESIESLKDYCLRNELILTDDIVSVIDKRIEKTKDRTELVSGLNFKVETGLICEIEALSKLDEWKEKNEN